MHQLSWRCLRAAVLLFASRVAAAMADLSDADSDGDAGSTGGASTACSTTALLVIIFKGKKVAICKLCQARADEPSPLMGAHASDQWGGLRPWAHYIKVKEDGKVVGRAPNGKVCMLCTNVFNALGFALSVFDT